MKNNNPTNSNFMSTNQNTIWAAVIVVAGLCLFNLGNSWMDEGPKTAYVDYRLLFDGFELKQELEKQLVKETSWQQKMLDSLRFELQATKNTLEAQSAPAEEEVMAFRKRQAFYYEKQSAYERSVSELTGSYDEQILTQMMQYINSFGEEKGYEYIFGLDDSGNLLYGREARDITQEIITYINHKYQGK